MIAYPFAETRSGNLVVSFGPEDGKLTAVQMHFILDVDEHRTVLGVEGLGLIHLTNQHVYDLIAPGRDKVVGESGLEVSIDREADAFYIRLRRAMPDTQFTSDGTIGLDSMGRMLMLECAISWAERSLGPRTAT